MGGNLRALSGCLPSSGDDLDTDHDSLKMVALRHFGAPPWTKWRGESELGDHGRSQMGGLFRGSPSTSDGWGSLAKIGPEHDKKLLRR